MGWQTSGKYRYYVRAIKRNGRIYREYFGRGLAAELAAQTDAKRRAEREALRQACRAMDARLDAVDAPTADFDAACGVAMSAVLLAAGFYRQDKHAWRKRGVKQRQKR